MKFSRRFTYLILIISALFVLATSIVLASGATWTQATSSPQAYWDGITSSADGTDLAADAYYYGTSSPGYIYTSTNGGETWATSTAPTEHWEGIASSADGTDLAAGKHIVCQFTANINNGTGGGDTSIDRALKFYLDDTHAQLVSEGGDLPEGTMLFVRTETYSDMQIDAEISTGVVDGMRFFGQVTDGHVAFRINRVTGVAAYAARLLPRGAEAGMGTCREVAPPRSKF